MNYIKVFCLESRFSDNDIFFEFDYIQVSKDRYEVVSDGEVQISFPILPGHAIRVVKNFYASDLDITFVYFKYLEEEEE